MEQSAKKDGQIKIFEDELVILFCFVFFLHSSFLTLFWEIVFIISIYIVASLHCILFFIFPQIKVHELQEQFKSKSVIAAELENEVSYITLCSFPHFKLLRLKKTKQKT